MNRASTKERGAFAAQTGCHRSSAPARIRNAKLRMNSLAEDRSLERNSAGLKDMVVDPFGNQEPVSMTSFSPRKARIVSRTAPTVMAESATLKAGQCAVPI